MAITSYVMDVFKQQEATVVALDIPEITTLAKRIAFYDAMIDAAVCDPMDDEADQHQMLMYLKTHHYELVQQYQQLVNDQL